MRQTEATRPPLPHRVAGNLALDLANTFSWRDSPREIDHLRDAGAVLAWATEAGLLDTKAALPAAARPQLLADTLRLRVAIDQAGATIAQGRAPPDAALGSIRDLAARTLAGAALHGAPAHLAFADPDRIIGPIAWAALDLLRGDELGRLKQCPSEDCRWLFIDRSKNGSRRWCDMASCGDRAKKTRRGNGAGAAAR